MPFLNSERGIGRGEVAESRIEAPFLAGFMVICAVLLLVVHALLQDNAITVALAVSMMVFGVTAVRVDLGVYILVAAMLLSPEIDLGPVSEGDRELNVRYDDVLIIVIFLGVLVKLAFEGRQSLWRPSPINAGIVTYYIICIISTLLAVRSNLGAWDRRDAFFVMLKMAEYYMIFFCVGNAVRTLAEVRRQLTFFFVVAMIVSVIGLAMLPYVERLGTPFEAQGAEPNTLGGYLTVVMCVSMGLLTQAKTKRKRLLFLFLVAGAFVPFLFTLSRASYIAMVVGMLSLGIIARKLSVVFAVVLTLVLSPILMPPEVRDRVNFTFQRGTGEPVVLGGKPTGLQVDKSTYERLYVWDKVKYTLQIVPWFGGGVGWGKVLDSQYARVVMETGLLGMAAFLFLQYRLLRTTREAFRWSRDWLSRGLAIGATTSTIALIVHSLGTISFLIVRIMEPYWFLIALTVVVRELAIEEHARQVRSRQSAPVPVAAQGQPAPARP